MKTQYYFYKAIQKVKGKIKEDFEEPELRDKACGYNLKGYKRIL